VGICGVVFSIFNVYAISGGANDPKKAKGTSRILRACIQEALHFAANPKLITGDLNGDFDSFPELQTLCDSVGWQDLNAIASTWGQQTNMPTCRTAQSFQPTIRDYCLACPAALPMIKQFRVLDADLCPVHSTLQIYIVPPENAIWQYQSTPKRPLKELMEETFSDRFGQGPLQLPEDLHIDLEQHLGDTTLTDENAKLEVRVTPHPYLQKGSRQSAARCQGTLWPLAGELQREREEAHGRVRWSGGCYLAKSLDDEESHALLAMPVGSD